MEHNSIICSNCSKKIPDRKEPIIDGELIFCDKFCRYGYRKKLPDMQKRERSMNDAEMKLMGGLTIGILLLVTGVVISFVSYKVAEHTGGYYIRTYGLVIAGILITIRSSIGIMNIRKGS